MHAHTSNTLAGEVISVTHTANSCRITIELKGTPATTAALMKQSAVQWGFIEGKQVSARLEASHVLVGVRDV